MSNNSERYNGTRNLDSIVGPVFKEGLGRIANWYNSSQEYYLKSIFTQVGFKEKTKEEENYYVLPEPLSCTITYPVGKESELLAAARKKTGKIILERYHSFSDASLGKMNTNRLFFLLEKFGTNAPFDDKEVVSIFDHYKIEAARAVIRHNRDTRGDEGVLLVNVDLSGIQKFIYNITSSGALKNLRSRSFYIELLCNHLIHTLLEKFHLHQANVLMNGGGSVHILASCPQKYQELLKEVDEKINRWLLEEFNGRLYASFTAVQCTEEELAGDIAKVVRERLAPEVFANKQRKFHVLIKNGKFPFLEDEDPGYKGCKVCQKDIKDIKDTDEEAEKKEAEKDAERCSLCERLVTLGNTIAQAKYVYRVQSPMDRNDKSCLPIDDSWYWIAKNKESDKKGWVVYDDKEDFDREIDDLLYPVFAKTYIRRIKDLPKEVHAEIIKERELLENEDDEEPTEPSKDERTALMEHIAECSKGAKYIAALRMDADNMGKILQDGFYDRSTLEKVSSFSRTVNYFFKLHLDSLCRDSVSANGEESQAGNSGGKERAVQVIYAGGDDLFILGAWNETADLAVDIGEAFGKFTCHNMDLGLSGGLTVHGSTTPVNVMADTSAAALSHSKKNKDACWLCREVFYKCPLNEKGSCGRKNSFTPFYTDYYAAMKKRLDEREERVETKEPSRLVLTLKWSGYDDKTKGPIAEFEKYVKTPLQLFRDYDKHGMSSGFFHHTASLLNVWYEEGLLYLPRIVWALMKFKRKLKQKESVFNEKNSVFAKYDEYLHHIDHKRISTVHIPLTWAILLMRGGGSNG